MVVLYWVYVAAGADETGKVPISVPSVRGRKLDLRCEAERDEDLVMFFQDEFWAKGAEYHLADVSGIPEELVGELEKILGMAEDRRANEHRAYEDATENKLPKRRKRNYALYEKGVRVR